MSQVVGDGQYCDRYWECEFGQPELYDCPNGLVWVGKNQGIADGCDYPWRHTNICKNKDLASKYQRHKVPDDDIITRKKIGHASFQDKPSIKCFTQIVIFHFLHEAQVLNNPSQ